MTILEVLICTYGRRLAGIDSGGLPQVEGVRYLVSCQLPEDISPGQAMAACRQLSQRKDVEIRFVDGKGLSNNRNAALDAATAPLALIADDDTSFDADGLRGIIARFDADPALELITVRRIHDCGSQYPPDGHDLARPFKRYWPISIEIALRMEAVRRRRWRFSPLAGIGAPYLEAGEENIFLHNAVRSGAKCRFADIAVASHPGETTSGHSGGTPGTLRAKGACLRIIRGWATGLTRIPVEAFRAPCPTLRALLYIFQGYVYSIANRRYL